MATASAVREVAGQELPAAGTYTIDKAHSTVEFVARHLMISKVRGRFADFEGTVRIGDDPTDSSVEATVDAASITTSEGARDKHLRSADFFDAEQYPTLAFRSTGVEPGKGGVWRVHGELTIRDITRPVVLDVEFDGASVSPWDDQRLAFSATTEIDRDEWGLTWNQALDAGGVVVGRKVRIELAVQAVSP